MEKELGKVIHYFDKAMVAVIKLSDSLAVGDEIKIVYEGKDFAQKVESMEIDRKKIDSAKAGEEVAIKVDQLAHDHAVVYKIE